MIFEFKKLDTQQVVPNFVWTPNPKFICKMLFINLAQGLRKKFDCYPKMGRTNFALTFLEVAPETKGVL